MQLEALPPGPRWPRLAQTAAWGLRPLEVLHRWHRRHGPMFTMRIAGLGDLVVLADPDLVRQVFTGSPDVFHAGEANAAMEPILGPRSLLLLDGAEHLHERRMLLPPFHGDAISAYERRIAEIAAERAATWPVHTPFAIRPEMQRITLEVILRAVMGVSDPARLDALRALLPQLLDFTALDMWLVWLWPRILDTPLARRNPAIRAKPDVDRLLFEEIRAHRADPDGRDDILAMLVAARDSDGNALPDHALRDQLVTLLLAGHETTATALAWAFERLSRHPAALARVGEPDYLDAVIDETLRVRPVIDSVWRRTKAPVEIGGRRLPAGTIVMPSMALIQRTMFDDPFEFRPERFLGGAPAPYTHIPFGGGTRRCVGASFATMEIRTVLRTVLERYEISPTSEPGERARVRHVTLVPAKGGRVTLAPRY